MSTTTQTENPLVFEEDFLAQAGLIIGTHWSYEKQDEGMRPTVNLAGLLALADHAAKEHNWNDATLQEMRAGVRQQWAQERGQMLPPDPPPPPPWSQAKHTQLMHKGFVIPAEWAQANPALDDTGRKALETSLEAFLSDQDSTGVQSVSLTKDHAVVTYRPQSLLEGLVQHGWPIADSTARYALVALYGAGSPPSLAGFNY